MTEVWKPVVGFEGLYEVSNLGRVRSLYCGKILKPGPHKGGYVAMHLYYKGRQTSTTMHSIVAAAFIGPRPCGEEVCHNDGDKKNNRVNNLRYDTPSNNNQEKRQHGTLRFGEHHPSAKLSQSDIRNIRASRGAPQQFLADTYGVTFSNISAIQLRKSWRHV